jgi:hypothetical protein
MPKNSELYWDSYHFYDLYTKQRRKNLLTEQVDCTVASAKWFLCRNLYEEKVQGSFNLIKIWRARVCRSATPLLMSPIYDY